MAPEQLRERVRVTPLHGSDERAVIAVFLGGNGQTNSPPRFDLLTLTLCRPALR
jgi:hypothetical protein